MTVSEWANKYRYLSPTSSAEPGKWRTSRVPYTAFIMDCLSSHSEYQDIIFKKSAQIAGTELGNNWIGYTMDVDPAPMLMVMPTDETVKRNSKIRIAPMIDATPRLREKVSAAKSRDSDNSIFSKAFPGGVLIMTGANSAAGLRSMPVEKLFLDEVDAYKEDLDGEGSPIELAKARSRTFARRKTFMCSTPTTEGASVIDKEFQETDQNHWHVPCPHCAGTQDLVFEQLRWEEGKPETVVYVCIHCEEGIKDTYKTEMLNSGSWLAHAPEKASRKRIGFAINSLYSPLGWFSWEDVATQYEAIRNDVNKEKTFKNTVLGLCYRERGEAPAWQNIYNRREEYRINTPSKEVAFLTAGVDVQKDRLEVEIVGWGKDKISWSIDHRVLLGETNDKEVWDRLAAIVNETWIREDGVEMKLKLMAVDTGYNTAEAYTFCRRFNFTQVIPIKGSDTLGLIVSAPRSMDVSRSGKKIGTMKVWTVGVSVLKSELYGWLRLDNIGDKTPAGYCHFPQYAEEYFRGITAEQLEYKIIRGFRKYQWVKKYERNEPLDLRIYARAAASVVGLDRFTDDQLEKMRNSYFIGEKPKTQGKKKRERGDSIW